MSTGEESDVSALRAELARVASTTDVTERTLEVVAVVEAVSAPLGIHPVVVGGMAVYFWVESEEFLTYDIDVVMEVTVELVAKLAQLGFVRAPDGRHWELPGTGIFFEAPSANLDPDVTVVQVQLPSGRTAKVISRVDVLIDRLDEFQATGHRVVGQQVLMLLSGVADDEGMDLDARASSRRVSTILKAMRDLADDLARGREPPESDELHEIARTALRAEYSAEKP
ncbi:MAG TPA: hypothetical protein VGF15_05455 [Solirubrobacteraceae bacterium]